MIIETVTQEYTTHDVGRITIDDTLDLVILHKDNRYIVQVIENNVIDVEVQEVEFE